MFQKPPGKQYYAKTFAKMWDKNIARKCGLKIPHPLYSPSSPCTSVTNTNTVVNIVLSFPITCILLIIQNYPCAV